MKTKKYLYCACTFDDDGQGAKYYYKTDNFIITEGVYVIVPSGISDSEAKALVVSTQIYDEKDVPLPLEKTKDIIGIMAGRDSLVEFNKNFYNEYVFIGKPSLFFCNRMKRKVNQDECYKCCIDTTETFSKDLCIARTLNLEYKQTCESCEHFIIRRDFTPLEYQLLDRLGYDLLNDEYKYRYLWKAYHSVDECYELYGYDEYLEENTFVGNLCESILNKLDKILKEIRKKTTF